MCILIKSNHTHDIKGYRAFEVSFVTFDSWSNCAGSRESKEPDDGIAHPLGIWFRFCKNIWVVSFCLYLYPPCASYLNGAYYLYIIEVNGNIC